MGVSEKKRLKKVRDKVIKRDGNICCYCNKLLSINEITMEHITPKSKGGIFNLINLTVSCANCNSSRGNKPFFEFIKKFNFCELKLNKYLKLEYLNLKVKILNIAKEECLFGDDIPVNVIDRACEKLNIDKVSFYDYENHLDISLNEFTKRKKIRFNFQNLIKIITYS